MASALKRLEQIKLMSCFDPISPDSRPTTAQQEVFDDLGKVPFRIVRAGNRSGKTQTAARECAWVWTETHPTWSRPDAWGAEKLQLLVSCKTTKQVVGVIWRKISQFVPEEDYDLIKSGGQLQEAIHKKTGNSIVFLSHHAVDIAREKAQGFTSHWVWIDEMPASFSYLEELMRRIQDRNGSFMATFTPKVSNSKIRHFVDKLEPPHGKTYSFHMFDNPTYTEDKKQEIMSSLSGLPQWYVSCILEGSWIPGEEQVIHFDQDVMVKPVPPTYNQATWRHVEIVRPSLDSRLSLTIWAENPDDFTWTCIKALEVRGVANPKDLVAVTHARIPGDMKIVKRVCDTRAFDWYAAEANKLTLMNPRYTEVYNQRPRRGELLKKAQRLLSDGHIKFAPEADTAISQIEEVRWSEKSEGRVVDEHQFHMLDCLVMVADSLPKPDPDSKPLPWEQWLRRENDKRRALEKKFKGKGNRGIGKSNRMGRRR